MNLETMVESKQLVERWADLHRRDPHLRQRDGAAKLGITEAELLAAHVGGNAVRLSGDWKVMLHRLKSLGPVTALSRNEHAVIEKVGSYSKVEIHGPMGQVLDPGIDLRLFLSKWDVGFALTEETSRGLRHSLQFFDAFGTAIHKVFLGADSDVEAFHALVELHRSDDQEPTHPVKAPAPPAVEKSDDAVDVRALREGWEALEDTHDFVHLIRRLGIARTQALRLAGPQWAEPVAVPCYRAVLKQAAATKLPIMVFVGNQGIIQIHSGPIHTVKAVDGWLNILDPGFNLHLKEEGVASAWVVRKPTRDGTVTSVELYDAGGEMIAYLFSKRKPGQAEVDVWRELLAGLERSSPSSGRNSRSKQR
jgi:putative hemin transport protein